MSGYQRKEVVDHWAACVSFLFLLGFFAAALWLSFPAVHPLIWGVIKFAALIDIGLIGLLSVALYMTRSRE